MDYSDTTVIIPVKDEPAVEKVTKDVFGALKNCNVIIIHKGSLDMRFRHKNLTIIKQADSGKGYACERAAKYVTTEIMCFIDGDRTYEVDDLKKVIILVREGADMALGNRISNIKHDSMPRYVRFGNWVLTATGNLFFGLKIKDSQTGLRAIRTICFRKLELNEQYFGIESEMNIKAKKKGYKIAETRAKYYIRVGMSKQFKLVDGLKLFLLNFKLLLD
jgi:dolichol-phosphate hexosyltransferase